MKPYHFFLFFMCFLDTSPIWAQTTPPDKVDVMESLKTGNPPELADFFKRAEKAWEEYLVKTCFFESDGKKDSPAWQKCTSRLQEARQRYFKDKEYMTGLGDFESTDPLTEQLTLHFFISASRDVQARFKEAEKAWQAYRDATCLRASVKSPPWGNDVAVDA